MGYCYVQKLLIVVGSFSDSIQNKTRAANVYVVIGLITVIFSQKVNCLGSDGQLSFQKGEVDNDFWMVTIEFKG